MAKSSAQKAVIYGRVSTFDKDQDYGRQINELNQWAKKNNYLVVEAFAEKITGSTKAYEREEFKRLLEYIRANDIKMILVSELSRVGRLGVYTRLEIEKLAEEGINMFFYDRYKYTLDRDGNVDSQTMMEVGLMADLAKMELDRTKRRIKSGLEYSATKGKIQSSKFKPYGFKGDADKNISIVESEIEVVKKIFNLFHDGMNIVNITRVLNENNIPTRYNLLQDGKLIRGKKAENYSWNTRTVYRILTNRMYVGERYHKKELVFKFEPVLDKVMFDKVQQMIKQKANQSIRTVTNNNYLKGIITCACGCGMFINVDKTKRVNSYVCNTKILAKIKKDVKRCGNPSVNIDKLLDSLYTVLLENFITNFRHKKSDNNSDIEARIQTKQLEVDSVEKQLKKNRKSFSNLYDDYNNRDIERDFYLVKKKQIETEFEKLTTELEAKKSELLDLAELKSKPLKSYYTKEMFNLEVRNIVKNVTVSNSEHRKILKTAKDIAIGVKVTTVTNDIYQYTLSRYSTNYFYDGQIKPMTNIKLMVKKDDLLKSLRPKTTGKVNRYKGAQLK